MRTDDLNIIYALALALALGLIIGVEREWRDRDHEGDAHPAGVRTFGLIGLSGGIASILGKSYAALPAAGLALTIAVMIAAYWRRSQNRNYMGVTTIFAAFVAYGCGGLAAANLPIPATAVAIGTAMILGVKERLHSFVARLDQKEIFAALQFILIAGVVLPLAPNQRFGPYDAINPFEIWLMVVLISGLSFIGYLSARVLSASRGIIGTAILGGFVSSTAVALSFARMAKHEKQLERTLSAGVILASAIMFARVAVIAGAVWPPLLSQLGAPLFAMVVTSAVFSAFYLRRQQQIVLEAPNLSNPLEILPALIFAGVLAAIMLASRWLGATFGAEGIYALAVASGLADVDAITLSLSRFARDGLAGNVTVIAILLAAVTNTLVKLGLITLAGNLKMFRRVAAAFLLTILCGAVVAVLTLY